MQKYDIQTVLDLDKYPLNKPGSLKYNALVERCCQSIDADGLFNLEGLVKSTALAWICDQISPVMESDSYLHRRCHNIYFKPEISGLSPEHPALKEHETINHTICADQIADSILVAIYEYQPLVNFIAEVMGMKSLYLMPDPLARVNVMAYHAGEALNWHFDRSQFTTTLLLQKPESGGDFEYRTDLRTETDPNYEGVAKLLDGQDPLKKTLSLQPGSLNIFKGKNTPHRVAPVKGAVSRMIAVFSYYESPNVMFTSQERLGFYGRTH